MRSELFGLPSEGGSIAAASQWIEELLRGQIATTIAILAVAILGYQMLSGRVSAKGALRVVLGCFILFGSAAIARGVVEATGGHGGGSSPEPFTRSPPLPMPSAWPTASPDTNANPFDPYANNRPPE